MMALTSLVIIATTAVPAGASHVDLAKAEVDFGSCREVVVTKTVRAEVIAEMLPAVVDAAVTDKAAELVIRAAKCRWLKTSFNGHSPSTKHPIIVQVGVVMERDRLTPAIERIDGEEIYSLYTVTNSRALARAARAAAHARVFVTENIRFAMAKSEACGDPVGTVVSIRDENVPSFTMRGTTNAPGPKCDVQAVGPTKWWTVKHRIASAFTYLAHRQSVVESDTQLEVRAARNSRLRRIVGTAQFKTDSVRTGFIKVNDVSPDAVIVPHRLGA
jgi:hypothetical protein